jgi:hypothetical protein
LIDPFGRVGIGTTTPQSALHVDGSIQITTGGLLLFGGGSENADTVALTRINRVFDRTTLALLLGGDPQGGPNFDDFVINAGGVEQFQLTSDGRAFKTGVPVWEVLSDGRAKRDIQPLHAALDRVLQLHGRSFHYNDPTALGARPGPCIGFIAQQVEEIFPDWVGTDSDGRKTMHISGFEALAVEALRDLRREKDEQIETLRRENAALTERLARLEAMVERLVR